MDLPEDVQRYISETAASTATWFFFNYTQVSLQDLMTTLEHAMNDVARATRRSSDDCQSTESDPRPYPRGPQD